MRHESGEMVDHKIRYRIYFEKTLKDREMKRFRINQTTNQMNGTKNIYSIIIETKLFFISGLRCGSDL